MSLTMMIAGAALVLLLAALLVMQRRRAAAAAAGTAGDGEDAGTPARDDDWRAPGILDRVRMVLRGRGAGVALLRTAADEIRIRRDGSGVRLAHDHDGVYGGRPNWDHIAALTLAMGKAERCFPGADLEGVLRYVDKTVPVEYSPRLVADLEDERAPGPRGTAAAG